MLTPTLNTCASACLTVRLLAAKIKMSKKIGLLHKFGVVLMN